MFPYTQSIEQVKVESDSGLVQFKLWPAQRKALELLHSEQDVILLKSRQSGFSTLTGQDSMWMAMLNENWECMILSVTGEDAEVYLKRMMNSFKTLDARIQKIFQPIKINTSEIIWPWGSAIYSLPANKGYGRTVNRAVIDEYFKINPTRSHITIDEVLRNVKPALDKRKGQLIRVGTADGVNQQYASYMAAKNGTVSAKSFFFGCFDDPSMTKQRRAQIEKDFGESHANQEYPRNDIEAFLFSGNPRFETKRINEYMEQTIKPLVTGYLLEDGLEPNEKGEFKIYKKRDVFHQYIVVADVGEGVGQDPCCAKVFDRFTQEQVAEWHGQIEPELFGDILWIIGLMYNNAVIVCEANNHGHSTLNTLVRQREYPSRLVFVHNEIMREKPDDEFNRGIVRYGWKTTSVTRPIIVNNLASMILHMEVPAFNDNDVMEMLSFVVKNGKAQAESGCHDDRVMVLCIAYYLMNNDTFNAFYPIISRKEYENCGTCHESIMIDDEVGQCQVSTRRIKPIDWCSCWTLRTFDYEEYKEEVGLTDDNRIFTMKK